MKVKLSFPNAPTDSNTFYVSGNFMRIFIVALILFYLESCSMPASPAPEVKEHTSEHFENVDAVKPFAQSIKNGREVTIETAYLRDQIYDSINSPSSMSREFYFDVSMSLLKRGDAIMATALGKNILKLIETMPEDFCKFLDKYDSKNAENLGLTLGTYFLNHSPQPNEASEKVNGILQKTKMNKIQSVQEKLNRFTKLLFAGAKK